jgi:hypothetical protein
MEINQRKRTEQSKRVISYWVKKALLKADQNSEGVGFILIELNQYS